MKGYIELHERFREEDFKEICEHLERLNRLAELAQRLHLKGLEKEELKELVDLLVEVMRHSARRELLIVRTLQWFKKIIDLLPLEESFSCEKLRMLLKHFTPSAILDLKPGTAMSQILIPWSNSFSTPPFLTPWELVDELDALIDGFTGELQRHVRILIRLFDVMKPESIPWLVKFVEKNPGHIRSSLGEALCIWWLGRVLGETKEIWRNVKGPVKVDKVEVDAISVTKIGFAVAEVKISKRKDVLEYACEQVVLKVKELLKELRKLRPLGFYFERNTLNPLEVAVITLYNLEDHKEEVRNRLRSLLKENGVNDIGVVYDINDIMKALESWRSEAKERYKELFEVLAKILETVC
jgi:hypothetical protein